MKKHLKNNKNTAERSKLQYGNLLYKTEENKEQRREHEENTNAESGRETKKSAERGARNERKLEHEVRAE